MKVVVVGLRGFPNIQGGIETHCEELYPRLVQLGCECVVIRRSNFVKESPPLKFYKGVQFKDFKAPCVAGLEAVVHTFKGVWYAKKIHADILHIHAIGPSIAIPFAKLLGLKVVMTHHGPDYDREKWGWIARTVLKTGEWFAAKWADEIISISTVISQILKEKYNRSNHVHLIYNGISSYLPVKETDYVRSLGLQPGKYILAVGRLVEEKRFDKLIMAFMKAKLPGYKLIIAGDADYVTSYCCFLKNFAAENNVLMPGIVKGKNLWELYSHAALFVLPSSHEGLPITLLEAMSFRRKVLASNIPANLAVGLPQQNYFSLDDLDDFIEHIRLLLADSAKEQSYDLSLYDWSRIARQTKEVYQSLVFK